MLLLLDTWTSGFVFEAVEWAVVVLDLKTIDKYLERVAQAERIHHREGAAFCCIRYWDGLPTWWGYSEAWEELYTDSVQIVNHLQAGNEQGQSFATSCTMLVVTPEGVAWETTLKSSPGTAGTEVVTKAVLLELKLRQQVVERTTGQPTA